MKNYRGTPAVCSIVRDEPQPETRRDNYKGD